MPKGRQTRSSRAIRKCSQPQYAACHSLEALIKVKTSKGEDEVLPEFSIVRCALEMCAKTGQPTRARDVFALVLMSFPAASEEEAAALQVRLCVVFQSELVN